LPKKIAHHKWHFVRCHPSHQRQANDRL